MGDRKQGWSAAGISALTPLHPFYRAEFGSKGGDLHVTEFAEFAQFAEPAGHTSIAIPLRYRLRAPGRRGDRLPRRRRRAGARGGTVGRGRAGFARYRIAGLGPRLAGMRLPRLGRTFPKLLTQAERDK